MKKKEKRMLTILVGITIVAIIILIAVKSHKKEDIAIEGDLPKENEVIEEFVEKTEDGTKVNISNKLKETKKLEGLEIRGITLTEQNNASQLLATVENKTSSTQGGYAIRIYVLDKTGKEIVDVGGYIKKLEPGESCLLNCNASIDYANAYDVRIEKQG